MACYALALVLLIISLGFDHGRTRWLAAAGLLLLGIGMGASAFIRLAILVADRRGRAIWWTSASGPSRALRVGALVARIAATIFVWYLAIRALGS
jgi:hypothetical protein